MGTLPSPTSPLWLVADALSRVAVIRAALDDGLFHLARQHAEELESELMDLRARIQELLA